MLKRLIASKTFIVGEQFEPSITDINKMKQYKEKGSDPERLASDITNLDKAVSRYFLVIAMDWKYAFKPFEDRCKELYKQIGLSTAKINNTLADVKKQAKNFKI